MVFLLFWLRIFPSEKIASIPTVTIVHRINFFNKVVVNFFTFRCFFAFFLQEASDEERRSFVAFIPLYEQGLRTTQTGETSLPHTFLGEEPASVSCSCYK